MPVAGVRAGLTYDLRFSDGLHTKFDAATGNLYTLELWARVSGTNGTVTDEGLSTSYIAIYSAQINGGAFFGGGLSRGTIANGFNDAGSRSGTGSDLNADTITDWGSTSTSSSNTNYMLVRNATPTTGALGGGTLGQAVNANTWEFKIASFTLAVGSLSGQGDTGFYVVQPMARAITGDFTYASARVDGSAFPVTRNNTQGAYSGSLGATISGAFSPPPPPPPPSTIAWDGGPTGTSAQWLTPENWGVDPSTTTQHVPGYSDTVEFGPAGTASVIGIDMGGAINGPPSAQMVNEIVLRSDANRDITIENSSSSVDGNLFVVSTYGNTGLTNLSADRTLTIRNGTAGRRLSLLLYSKRVNVANPGASIVIETGMGNAWLDKYGQGQLVLSGACPDTDLFVHEGRTTLTSTGVIGKTNVWSDAGSTLDIAGTVGSGVELRANGTINSISGLSVARLSGSGALNLVGVTTLAVPVGSFSGSLSGAGSLVKWSTTTLTLSGTLSYTGVTNVSGGSLILTQSHRSSSSLSVFDGAKTILSARGASGAKTLQVGTLSIAPTGTLDLADNDLVVDNGTFSDIQAKVLAGFGNTSGGIISSTSNGTQILALFDNALIGANSWNGGTIAPNAIVGKYTYFGDVNLDGQVSGDDYTVIDSNLNTTPPAGAKWINGDANLDGTVTGDDYTTIDSNLGLGGGNPLASAAMTAVPEPISAAAVALLATLRIRRRRQNLS